MRWTCVTNTTFINFWIFYEALDSYLFQNLLPIIKCQIICAQLDYMEDYFKLILIINRKHMMEKLRPLLTHSFCEILIFVNSKHLLVSGILLTLFCFVGFRNHGCKLMLPSCRILLVGLKNIQFFLQYGIKDYHVLIHEYPSSNEKTLGSNYILLLYRNRNCSKFTLAWIVTTKY